MEFEKNELSFPSIDEIKKQSASEFSQNPLVGLQIAELCAFIRDRFYFTLGPTSGKYFLIKLPAIISAAGAYFAKQKAGDLDNKTIANALLRCVNQRASLLEQKDIDIKKILLTYSLSPHIQKKKQQEEMHNLFKDEGKEIATQGPLQLVKLQNREDIYHHKTALKLGVLFFPLSERVSTGKSEIYAIKNTSGELKQGNIREEVKKTPELPLFMIEYDYESKSIVYMRGRDDALLSANDYFFPQISALLIELIKKITTPNGKNKKPDLQEMKCIKDVEGLENSLRDNTVLTMDGIKAMHLPTKKKSDHDKKMKVVNENDTIIASGRYILTPEIFDDKILFQEICNIPEIRLDFTNLEQNQKKLISKVAGKIIDETATGDIIYAKLTKVADIRAPYASSVKLPLLTMTGTISAQYAKELYLPKLKSVKQILAPAAQKFECESLEKIEADISIPKKCKHNVPTYLQDKITTS